MCRNKTLATLTKLNGNRELLASCYHHSRFVDCRIIKQNTKVVVIYIYSSYLQQNGELILNISQVMTSKKVNIRLFNVSEYPNIKSIVQPQLKAITLLAL